MPIAVSDRATFQAYSGFLSNVGSKEKLDRSSMRQAISQVSAIASTEADVDDEWADTAERVVSPAATST
jgi:hypothetical protein